MHRVLQIPEVILNIFSRIVPSGPSEDARKGVDADLAALARTCHAFKEPALDILWSELDDPTPLIKCLPRTSYRVRRPMIARKTASTLPTGRGDLYLPGPLEQAELDILRSYARRLWCLRDLKGEFNWNVFADLTSTEPLFPNLRSLHCNCNFRNSTRYLLHLPFPSLIRLDISVTSSACLCMLQDPLKSLSRTSPNIKRLGIFCKDCRESEDELKHTQIVSDNICGWSNLQSLACPDIPLDVDTLVHLSRMPSLTQLTFMLSDTVVDSTALSNSLSFSALNYLKLHTEHLTLISRLLPRIRLPTITNFTVIVDGCPSKEDLGSFMASIQMVGMHQTIQEFNLNQVIDDPEDVDARDPNAPILDLDDLRPCMTFHRLRRMNVDLGWDVNLPDDELPSLALAWPRLEELCINTNWGWNRPGITPNGLAQILETCPSLTSIALAINPQGYSQIQARQFRNPVNPSSFDQPFRINVLDSVIERGSMDNMVAFLAAIVPHFDFILTAWEGRSSADEELGLYCERWREVHSQASEVIKKRWADILCGLFFPSRSSSSEFAPAYDV